MEATQRSQSGWVQGSHVPRGSRRREAVKRATMRYLLPILVAMVAWPTAPAAQEFELTVDQSETRQGRSRAQREEGREQDKIGRRYLSPINPLDRFHVKDGHLWFANLAEHDGVATAEARYSTRWMVYDKAWDEYLTFTPATMSTRPAASLPEITLGVNHYLVAEITTVHAEQPSWKAPAMVYLRSTNGQFTVVGVERPAAPPTASTN